MFTALDHPLVGVREYLSLPVRLSRTPGGQYAAAPTLGQHTIQILEELGRDADQIAQLTVSGVIGTRPPRSAARPVESRA
jgi:crotonobetainyl-CoA:carnitine CoA-transferase CaiB-like acyl-CoA transferase